MYFRQKLHEWLYNMKFYCYLSTRLVLLSINYQFLLEAIDWACYVIFLCNFQSKQSPCVVHVLFDLVQIADTL